MFGAFSLSVAELQTKQAAAGLPEEAASPQSAGAAAVEGVLHVCDCIPCVRVCGNYPVCVVSSSFLPRPGSEISRREDAIEELITK